jgi:hypothetical protein
MFQKQQGSNYFSVGATAEDDVSITFAGQGLVINIDTNEIQVFGGAKKWLSSSKRTEFPITPISDSSATINGQAIVSDLYQCSDVAQFNGSVRCLSNLDSSNNLLTLFAQQSGIVVYQSSADLIVAVFDFDSQTVEYASKLEKGYTSVWFNGANYIPGTDLFNSMFLLKVGKNRDILLLREDNARTDNFYVEYQPTPNTTSVVKFALPRIVLNVAQYSDTQPSFASVLQHYECSIQGANASTNVVTVLRLLDDQQTAVEDVKISFQQVDPTVLAAQHILLTYYHANQLVTIDYSQWSNVIKVTSVDGKLSGLQQVISGPKSFDVQLQSGQIFQSTVVPILVPYTVKDAKHALYIDPTLKTVSFATQFVYIINDVVYVFGQGTAPSCASEDTTTNTVMISLSPDVLNYGSYVDGVWSMRGVRLAAKIPSTTTYVLFTTGKQTVDLRNEVGVISKQSEASFYQIVDSSSEPKLIKNGKLVVAVPDDAAPGNLISTVNLLAKVDVFETLFTMTFVYDQLRRMSFYLPGDVNFPENNGGSIRKSNLAGKCLFGNFLFNDTDNCVAYGVSIDSNADVDPVYVGSDTKLYPIVSFDATSTATIIPGNNGCVMNTGVITDDIVIPYTKLFNRLSYSSDLVVTSGTVTIPKIGGTCFFRTDDTINLFRPETAVRFGLSRTSSAASSATTSPTSADGSVSPSPAGSSASPSVSLPRRSSLRRPSVSVDGQAQQPVAAAPPSAAPVSAPIVLAPLPKTAPVVPAAAKQPILVTPSTTIPPSASPAASAALAMTTQVGQLVQPVSRPLVVKAAGVVSAVKEAIVAVEKVVSSAVSSFTTIVFPRRVVASTVVEPAQMPDVPVEQLVLVKPAYHIPTISMSMSLF